MKKNNKKKSFQEKISKKKIEELCKETRHLKCGAKTFTYIKIYQIANELYGIGQFSLASDICDCTIQHLQNRV